METTEQRISSIAKILPDKTLRQETERARRENRLGLIGTLLSVGIGIGAIIYAINSDTDTKKIAAVVPVMVALGGVAVSLAKVEASGQFALILANELENRHEQVINPLE